MEKRHELTASQKMAKQKTMKHTNLLKSSLTQGLMDQRARASSHNDMMRLVKNKPASPSSNEKVSEQMAPTSLADRLRMSYDKQNMSGGKT